MLYYLKKDLRNFLKFSKYFKKYKKHQILLNYLSADIYYKKRLYKKANIFYYRLSLVDSIYKTEALYKLAKISRHVYRKKRRAMKYLEKINSEDVDATVFKYQGLIDLAILYKESGKRTKSEAILKQIIATQLGGKFRIQAENLIKQFKFVGEKNG